MVTKTGPFSLVHHSRMKIVIPEHTTPWHDQVQIRIVQSLSVVFINLKSTHSLTA